MIKKYDKESPSRLLDYANELVSETSDVYTEIGIQAGILIMLDMMKNIGFYEGMAEEEAKRK